MNKLIVSVALIWLCALSLAMPLGFIINGNNNSSSRSIAHVETDKDEYVLFEKVKIRSSDFTPNAPITVTVSYTCLCGQTGPHVTSWVNGTADENGVFTTSYIPCYGWGAYNVTLTDGSSSAKTSFNVKPCRIWTDKWSYEQNETVVIYGSGFAAENIVNLTITLPDYQNVSWLSFTDKYGNFTVQYYLEDGLKGHYLVIASDGIRVAATVFIDPAIFLYPDSGPPGTIVTVQGDGFWGTGGGEIWGGGIYFAGEHVADIGADGTFTATFKVPDVYWEDTFTVSAKSRAWVENSQCQRECVAWGWLGCCTVETDNVCYVWWPFCEWGCVDYQWTCEASWQYYSASATFTVTKSIVPEDNPPVTTAIVEGSTGTKGWYVSDVTVTLNATDDSGVVETKYSFDGNNWLSYSTPITIEGEGMTKLYYWSMDTNNNTEGTRSIEIWIDKTPPTTKPLLNGIPGEEGWWRSNVDVDFSADDVVSGVLKTEYSFDEKTWFDFNESLTFSGQDGAILYYRSIDVAGNVEETHAVSIMIDYSLPTTSLLVAPNFTDSSSNIYVTEQSQLTLLAYDVPSGVAKIYYRVNGSIWQEYKSPFNLTGKIGKYLVEYYSVDVAGNEGLIENVTLLLGKVWRGSGWLHVNNRCYTGNISLYVYPGLIRLVFGNDSLTWLIEKHCQNRYIDVYLARGDTGKVIVILFHIRGKLLIIASTWDT
ncbi:MAG: OmpL47-type beta-barrel domain-containing protein [Candidatus Ranarchaeia archaeon]